MLEFEEIVTIRGTEWWVHWRIDRSYYCSACDWYGSFSFECHRRLIWLGDWVAWIISYLIEWISMCSRTIRHLLGFHLHQRHSTTRSDLLGRMQSSSASRFSCPADTDSGWRKGLARIHACSDRTIAWGVWNRPYGFSSRIALRIPTIVWNSFHPFCSPRRTSSTSKHISSHLIVLLPPLISTFGVSANAFDVLQGKREEEREERRI